MLIFKRQPGFDPLRHERLQGGLKVIGCQPGEHTTDYNYRSQNVGEDTDSSIDWCVGLVDEILT